MVFLQRDWPCCMAVVRTGQEVIRYLQGEGRYADRIKYPFPTLVVLDLKIRRVDAFKVLEWIRNGTRVRHMPVLVLADSAFDPDIARAYAAGANSFLVEKPAVNGEADRLYEAIEYWMDRAGVPVLDTTHWLQLLHNLPLPESTREDPEGGLEFPLT